MSRVVDQDDQEFAPVPTSVREVRAFVVDRLRRAEADEDVIDDFSIAVSELASNVVLHGGGAPIRVVLHVEDPAWWIVDVIGGDRTRVRLPEDATDMSDPRRLQGRGLGIVCELMDDVAVGSLDGAASVRCRMRRTASMTG